MLCKQESYKHEKIRIYYTKSPSINKIQIKKLNKILLQVCQRIISRDGVSGSFTLLLVFSIFPILNKNI